MPSKILPLSPSLIRLNQPLRFSVYSADGQLLLARGRIVATETQLQQLLERGACVRPDELDPAPPQDEDPDVHGQSRAATATLGRVQGRLNALLGNSQLDESAAADVATAERSLSRLVARDPDCALFHLLVDPADRLAKYSAMHAIRCAVAARLVATRLGWAERDRESLASAALTMNVAMAQVQGALAVQTTPPTAAQRRIIRDHPRAGAEMLRAAGVTDPDWLRAVEEHHETPDAQGYPRAIHASFEPAQVLRHVDIFLAKTAARATRSGLPAARVVRDTFAEGGDNPIVAAVVKEFGQFPPGTFVKLANGELAVVVGRGETAYQPRAKALVNKHGEAFPLPVNRDCANPDYAIVATIPAGQVRVYVDPRKLFS